jgi:hypothetical protein
LSLPAAQRGDKGHLRYLWEDPNFDFDEACRREGRNNAVFARLHGDRLHAKPAPSEIEQREIVRRANRATGGLNLAGERERYTLYELKATLAQVESYRETGFGVMALIVNHRRWARGTRRPLSPMAKKLFLLLCDEAQKRGKWRFYLSHRTMASALGIDRNRICGLLNEIRDVGKKDLRDGETKPFGNNERGTTIISLRPAPPAQAIDELERPTFDYVKAKWVWRTSLAKGKLPMARCRWLARQGLATALAAGMPYVLYLSLRGEKISRSKTNNVLNSPLRGSP